MALALSVPLATPCWRPPSRSIVRTASLRRASQADAGRFIQSTYARHYGAEVGHALMPHLLALFDRDGAMTAAFGLKLHDDDGMMARYLGQPARRMLPAPVTPAIPLLEMGNLAGERPGAVRALVRAMAPALATLGCEWLLCTATRELRNGLSHAGTVWQPLAAARIDALPLSERARWGRYFDHDPQVVAIDVRASCERLDIVCGMAEPGALQALTQAIGGVA
ncbi:MAG: thermostable hemolysin [Polycyclovorans sp.]|nr:thermostable hemolysin [Polycyclovorans sp.]MEC8848174.1 thermostable hemolysin [Pseudomonadota bacterium]